MNLEQEIISLYKRIEKRSEEVEQESSKLDNNIKKFTWVAWGFVVFGFLAGIYGINDLVLCMPNEDIKLNELGDFYAGTVASLWSLAGLFFIYVAFLGQKQQLLSQKLELMYNQAEVKSTRLELQGQKNQLITQNKTLKLQQFESTYFNFTNQYIKSLDSLAYKNLKTGRETIEEMLGQLKKSKNEYDNLLGTSFKSRFKEYINETLKVENLTKNKISLNLDENQIPDYQLDCFIFHEFYNNNLNRISHLFGSINNIILLTIENNSITYEDKKRYLQYFFRMMSTAEINFFFYYLVNPQLGIKTILGPLKANNFLIKVLIQFFDFKKIEIIKNIDVRKDENIN